MLFSRSVTPHFLQFVKLTGFRLHNVYHHVYIVSDHPLSGLATFMMKRNFAQFLFYVIFNIICDSLYLSGTAGFTDNEKISNCFGNLTEIKGDDIFPFFFPEWRE